MSVNGQEEWYRDVLAHQEKSGVEKITFNYATISGVIEDDFRYSHTILAEPTYETRVVTRRKSGVEDFVPIRVSESRKNKFFPDSAKGKFVRMGGRFCSNRVKGEDGKMHLQLYLDVVDIGLYETEEYSNEFEQDINSIFLQGYIREAPRFRITPLGREITDLNVFVNRGQGSKKRDLIPCIAWWEVAHAVNELKIGDKISLFGRIQSRQYFKRYSPNSENGEWRTVYEVSILQLNWQ